MKIPRGRRLAALALSGALIFAACGDDDSDADFNADDSTGTDIAGQDQNDSDSGDVIGVDFPDPDDVVAEGTFVMPRSESDEVRIGVVGIFATDESMELRLVITPLSGDEEVSVYQIMHNGTGVIPTTLIDRANLKEYTVLRDGPSRFETDPHAEVHPGESVGYQRFFAPPEDDIEVVDVFLHADWPVLKDVPITYEA